MRQEQIRRTSSRREEDTVEQFDEQVAEKQDRITKAETELLLDEIAVVLEENAEEFAEAYLQKGGE